MSKPLTMLDLFSGIGGFSYAAERLVGGFQTVAFCDSDSACRRVLRKHWPTTPIFEDVCTLQAEDIQPLCPNGLSLITAGFPCQDLSAAGKQAGYDGERSVLFYEIIRLARELRPQFLLLENVRNLLSHKNGETFQETLFQIAKAGYDAEWAVIPASDLGACHRRERIWIVAHASNMLGNGGTNQYGRQSGETSLPQSGDSDWQDASHSNAQRLPGSHMELSIMYGGKQGREVGMEDRSGAWAQQWPQWRTGNQPLSPNWRSYVCKPVLCRGDDGLRGRVDRLKQLGNSIVPQVAAVPLQRIKELSQHESQ